MRGMALCFPAVDENFWITPPRARGKRHRRPRPRSADGITPACAGKTCRLARARTSSRDHPRMRGEDDYELIAVTGTYGSPPHARGRHLLNAMVYGFRRITPACAGKTDRASSNGSPTSDHPRMRGEDSDVRSSAVTWTGSPPHARGRHDRDRRDTRTPRITPACAGKTRRSRLGGGKTPDHPRMRGEDLCYTSHV